MKKSGLLRTHLPYLVERFFDREGWFALNRYYAGLGTIKRDIDNVIPLKLSSINERKLRDCAVCNQENRIYFYDDLTAPWRTKAHYLAYNKRLQVFNKIPFFKGSGLTPWYVKIEDWGGYTHYPQYCYSLEGSLDELPPKEERETVNPGNSNWTAFGPAFR